MMGDIGGYYKRANGCSDADIEIGESCQNMLCLICNHIVIVS
jgi:hypothetical protein